VKQDYVYSSFNVTSDSTDLPPYKSDLIGENINKLESLIINLQKLKDQKRNYLQILEPIVVLTEQLLDDYHSTALLYKVLRVLFPNQMPLYILAVREALVAHSIEPTINRGAIFVNALRQLAEQEQIDLGLKRPVDSHTAQQSLPIDEPPLNALEPQTSVEEAIWAETLSQLQGQMVKSTFSSVMQGTRLVGLEDDTYVIQVATPLAKDWLENRLRSVVERALGSVIGSSVPIKVAFRV
ncbi:MAG: DnaA N-terminal domain-containing protein, partial [Chloroflexota bacterium]